MTRTATRRRYDGVCPHCHLQPGEVWVIEHHSAGMNSVVVICPACNRAISLERVAESPPEDLAEKRRPRHNKLT